MQCFVLGQKYGLIEPALSGRWTGDCLFFKRQRIAVGLASFVNKERNNMGIDLRNNEVIHIEHLCKSSHGQIIVNRSIDPALRGGIPGESFSSLEVLGKKR